MITLLCVSVDIARSTERQNNSHAECRAKGFLQNTGILDYLLKRFAKP